MERLKGWQNLLGAAVLALALVGSALVATSVQWDEEDGVLAGAMGAARERFDWIIASRVTIEQGGLAVQGAADVDATLNVDGAATLNSTLDVDGLLTLAGGLSLTDGGATVADDFVVSAQTAISCTDGGVITPTGTYQPLQSAGTVTPTVTTSGVATGTLLVLVNTSATTVNLPDSGTMMLSGAAALGQHDSLVLWFDGTNWIQVGGSDN